MDKGNFYGATLLGPRIEHLEKTSVMVLMPRWNSYLKPEGRNEDDRMPDFLGRILRKESKAHKSR